MRKRTTLILVIALALVTSNLIVQARGDVFTNPLPESNVYMRTCVTQNIEQSTLEWEFTVVSNRILFFTEYLNVSVTQDELTFAWHRVQNGTLISQNRNMSEPFTTSRYTLYGTEQIPMTGHFAALHSLTVTVTWIDNCSLCFSEGVNLVVSTPVPCGNNLFYHEAKATTVYRDYGPIEPWNPPWGRPLGYCDPSTLWLNLATMVTLLVAILCIAIHRRITRRRKEVHKKK